MPEVPVIKTEPAKKAGKTTGESKAKSAVRPVIYPKPSIKMYHGPTAMKAEEAKKILGWTVEPKGEDWGEDFLLRDTEGRKVRCYNNRNRPFYDSNMERICQDLLLGNWEFNFENRIIGKTGLVMDGQHCLIALVIADERWHKAKEKYPHWKTAPTLATTVGFGCDETESVIRTLNTGRPQSVSDVVYRSEYFADMEPRERRVASKAADWAIRTVWSRTGGKEAHLPYRTNSESILFVEKHPRLLECVRDLCKEDGEKGNISGYLGVGYAAGLFYLMAASKTKLEKYQESPREGTIDFANWALARKFWVEFAGNSKKLESVRQVFADMTNQGQDGRRECECLFIKAWLVYSDGKPVTAGDVALRFSQNDDGVPVLDEFPQCGGIDQGDAFQKLLDETDDPSPEEITRRAAAERLAKQNKKRGKLAEPEVGQVVWVEDPEDGGVWQGKLLEAYDGPAHRVAKVQQRNGKAFEAPMSTVHTSNPLIPAGEAA